MKKVTMLIFLLSCITTVMKGQSWVENHENSHSSFEIMAPHHLKAQDVSSPFSLPIYTFYSDPNPSKKRDDAKYALKGISLHYLDETMPDGTYEYLYDAEGNRTKTIFLGCAEYVVDSGVSVYYPGFMSWDYYGYMKNANGEYKPSYKWETIYASPEENGSDSTYEEDYSFKWNEGKQRWDNDYLSRVDYSDPNYLSEYSRKRYSSSNGMDWIMGYGYWPYQIDYNEQGYIEKYYYVQMPTQDSLLYEYKYNADGSYYEFTISFRENGAWVPDSKISEIEWKEYWGFTWVTNIDSHPEPTFSPFSPNRNKVISYMGYDYNGGDWELSHYKKWDWDIDGTLTYSCTAYYAQNGLITEYPATTRSYFFNEHGDFVGYTNSAFSMPDENGEIVEFRGTTYFYILTYEEDYGLSGSKYYAINYGSDGMGAPDTTFRGGYQITEFGPLPPVSIDELGQTNRASLNIYPNPAKEYAVFEFRGDFGGQAQVELQNIAGQVVDRFELRSSQYQYPASKLEQGVYLATLKVNGKRVATEKVIILK